MPDYTTIEMIEAIELTPPVRTFLSRTFFPQEHTHIAEKVEFDVRKGKRIMAPFVSPRIGGKVITRQGFNTKEFSTPIIAPEREMSIDDITKRGIGENLYSTKTPEERENTLLARDYQDLDESIQRRIEWMARSILFTGKLDIVDEENGVDVQVDYGFDNIYVMSSSQYWSVGTVNPMPILKKIRRQIIKESGAAPNILIMGSVVIDDFLENSFIKEAINKLNLKNITIEPRVIDSALTFYGRIAELDLDIYSYDEYFIDDNKEENGIIPANACLMANSNGIGSIEYGLITQYEKDEKAHSYEAKKVPKVYVDHEVKKLRITSRPLPRPINVESWAVIYPNGEGEEE
ncbi:major capsid protein [Lachnotalea glycerini]|uniref:Major capsid protein n=1 Tax=Lachnotalea glycerini TaxID=1763509 RepID=A0A371JC93_9FIRM|nr:major capsid protein [Lachnotalea glycerini]RDY30297.1 major capsid protein [Lachnotalea glycerini]